MKFKRIIVPNSSDEVHGLWAVQYAGEPLSDFFKLLGRDGLWSQQLYLHQFFKRHATDLEEYDWKRQFPGGAGIAEAQLQTVEFAHRLSSELQKVAQATIAGGKPDFDQFFSNYNNNETAVLEMGLSKK